MQAAASAFAAWLPVFQRQTEPTSASHAAAPGNAASPPLEQACGPQFSQLFGAFVDHVVATGYNRSCTAQADAQPAELPPLRLPPAKRLVAIGDLHGDLDKALRAFRLAGLVDERGAWAGGNTVCVQVGDILDRGDQEIKLLFLLERLQRQAAAAGGALHVLNGNHETMNVGGNFRYATQGADLEMAAWRRWEQLGQRLKDACDPALHEARIAASAAASSGSSDSSPRPPGPGSSGAGEAAIEAARAASDTPAAAAAAAGRSRQYNPLREAALRPGGPITRRFFAPHPTVLQVGSTLFVHGGVLPSHVQYGLERINAETRDWLLGASGGGGTGGASGRKPAPPAFLRGADAIVWAREYSARDEALCDCEMLRDVLGALPGARRMVVGHTIQEQGINGACGGRVLRVDVGLSKGCGNGDVQVLEITGDGQSIVRLREGLAPEPLHASAPSSQQQLLEALKQQQQQQQQQPGQQQGSATLANLLGSWLSTDSSSGGGSGAARTGAGRSREPTPA